MSKVAFDEGFAAGVAAAHKVCENFRQEIRANCPEPNNGHPETPVRIREAQAGYDWLFTVGEQLRKLQPEHPVSDSKRKAPWFPESPDREHLERVLFALSCAMGYSGAEGIVSDYLDGKSVLTRIGSRGVWHFDHMTRTCGMKPPEGA